MSVEIDRLATAVTTRRGTLALGSAAALLGLSRMGSAEARKNGKKRKNKKKKSCTEQAENEVAQACGRQASECAAYFSSTCGSYADPQKCISTVTTCCNSLAECRFTEMLQCLQTNPIE